MLHVLITQPCYCSFVQQHAACVDAGVLLQDLHEQLDDKDDFEDSAHLDKESWGEFFALHQ